jgi:hypothetical protein
MLHCLVAMQALPAYQRALDLNPMSEEIISKVRELKKKVKPTPKVSPAHCSTSTDYSLCFLQQGCCRLHLEAYKLYAELP